MMHIVDESVIGWDMQQLRRDFGFVFGSNAGIELVPAQGSRVGDAFAVDRESSPEIVVHYTLSLAPGERKSLVLYSVLGSSITGKTATGDASATLGLDQSFIDLIDGVKNDSIYRLGMTTEEVENLANSAVTDL